METTNNVAMSETGGCGCSSQRGGRKRKLSAYNIFMKKELKALKAQYPAKKITDLMKMAAKKWKASQPKSSSMTKTKTSRKTKTARKTTRKSSK
jgi:hypothetical protein